MAFLLITALLAGSATPLRADSYRLGIAAGETSPTYNKLFAALKERGLVVDENLQIVPLDISRAKTPEDLEGIRREIAARCDLFFTTGSLLPALLKARIKTPLLFVSFNNQNTVIPPEMRANSTGFYRGYLAEMFESAARMLPAERRHKLGLLFFDGSSLQNKALIYRKVCQKIGVELVIKTFVSHDDLERAMHEYKAEGAGAVLIMPPSLRDDADLAALVTSQNRLKMPVISFLKDHIEKGVMGGQTIDYRTLIPTLADYIIKILRGRSAGQLPIRHLHDKYVVNLSTVSRMGIVITQDAVDHAEIVGIASDRIKKVLENKPQVSGNFTIGFARSTPKPVLKSLLDALTAKGYIEGRNLHLLEIDLRSALSEEQQKKISAQLANETNLFFASGNVLPILTKFPQLKTPICFIATKESAASIPEELRPLFTGVIKSSADSIIRKSQQMIPGSEHLGLIARADSNMKPHLKRNKELAAQAGLTAEFRLFSNIAEIGPLMTEMMQRNDFILLSPPAITREDINEIVFWQKNLQLPVLGQVSSHIENGLLGGPVIDLQKIAPKLAEYIDKLLQGRPPEKLPVFHYTEKYMINLNTAADLDLKIPVEILSQATIIRETRP
jgi:ABC-type uncharacterized transport system substrate-binding protein